MRARQLLGIGTVALVLLACQGGDDATTPVSTTASAPPVTSGPVAAVDLATGDCLSGLVIGVAERVRIDSAQVVSCESAHELEVFATFRLAATDFPSTPAGDYPGEERVVAAADAGCSAQLERLGPDNAAAYGLIALWPTNDSWMQGDRAVGCAAYSNDGRQFDGRQLLAGG